MLLFIVSLALNLLSVFVATVVLVRAPARRESKWLFAFIVFGAFWNGSVNAQGLIHNETVAVWLLRSAFCFVIAVVFSMIKFVDAVSDEKSSYWRVHYLVLLLGFLLPLTPWVISSLRLEPGFSVPVRGALYYPIVLIIAGYASYAAAVCFVRAAHKRASVGGDLRVVGLGLAVGTIVGVLTNVVLPNIYHTTFPSRFAFLSLFIWASILAYAIVRRRLFDVRFFAVRAVAYLTTLFTMTFIFIAPFIAAVNGIILRRRPLAPGEFAVIVILSVGLLYALQYMRRFFDTLTDKIFLRKYYSTQEVLARLSNALAHTADMASLRQQTAAILQMALRPGSVGYALSKAASPYDAKLIEVLNEYCNEQGVTLVDADVAAETNRSFASLLRKRHVALAAKLMTTDEELGYLILDYRPSGLLYTQRDIQLLSAAANEIAISMQNVLRFEEIQRFNLTLQDEVDAATLKLKRQNKRLEELDDIKDDFISMASHQLRTPLTSVKGYLSMVLEGDAGKINPQQAKMLGQAFTSAQRMVFLITDLLNVSRLKTGKFIIDATPVDLSEMIQEEVDQLRETAEVKGLRLKYKKPKSFPKLMLDEVKIRQVAMNFMDNAIYYTPSGGHITVELLDKPASVELRVVDDGIGVPRSEQHHLFTKFYRATNARKARPDGTGLGLFMAAKVIVAQGGSVIFSSKEGKGSTFGFRLSKSQLPAKDSSGSQHNA